MGVPELVFLCTLVVPGEEDETEVVALRQDEYPDNQIVFLGEAGEFVEGAQYGLSQAAFAEIAPV
jgi:hypothetical protein